jgi:hypothetical protein
MIRTFATKSHSHTRRGVTLLQLSYNSPTRGGSKAPFSGTLWPLNTFFLYFSIDGKFTGSHG